MSCCCTDEERTKHKPRTDKELKSLVNRLNRIEGQICGIKKMLEANRYCPDILMQVSSVQSALNSFNKELLSSHIKSCVVDDIKEGNEEAVDELCELLKKTMK
ncbi:MAG: metal-sensing transcriptional repressor [Lachnospiraceae bacterium]|nr:metal-sensing transcriptional repressor [Lachnospiraceae bacterium]